MERLGSLIQRKGVIRVPEAISTSPIAFRDWEAAVGTRIAARARPIRLYRGVLHVLAASSTWAQELALQLGRAPIGAGCPGSYTLEREPLPPAGLAHI